MGLARGWHLAAQQNHCAARLIEREGCGHHHAARDPLDRIGNPGNGAPDLRLNLGAHFGSDGGSEVVFVLEVVEEASLGHPGAGDEIVDRDRIDRARCQQVEPGRYKGRAGALYAG